MTNFFAWVKQCEKSSENCKIDISIAMDNDFREFNFINMGRNIRIKKLN